MDGLFDDEEEEVQQGMAAGLELEGPGGHGGGGVVDVAELEKGSDVVLKGAVEVGGVASGAEHLELEHLIASLPLAEVELRH